MTGNPSSNGLTLKELILRLEGKLDGYINSHEQRHAADGMIDSSVRSDPAASASGRALMKMIEELTGDVNSLASMVRSHERTVQRLVGGFAVATFIGGSSLILLILRIVGIIG